MSTPHKHAALIKAWADGAMIQYKDPDGSWVDTPCPTPCWDKNVEYRIKLPDPIIFVFYGTLEHYNDTLDLSMIRSLHANLKFTFVDYKLKAVEIL